MSDKGALLKANIWINDYITSYQIVQHGCKEILTAKNTPFQEMMVVDLCVYGKALVLDGKIQCTVGDEKLYHEPLCHVPLILHTMGNHGEKQNGISETKNNVNGTQNGLKVLILGGGDGGCAREFLKWKSVEKIVIADLDEDVVNACKEHLPEIHGGCYENEKVDLKILDALKYIDDLAVEIENQNSNDNQGNNLGYDVIVSDLTDPIENGPSAELFTLEHFARCKKVLNPNGIFVMQAGPSSLLESPMHPRLVKTLERVYRYAKSYQSSIPTFGTPLAFIVATDDPQFDETLSLALNSPQVIDEIIEEHIGNGNESLEILDGKAMQGLFRLSKEVRNAIAKETFTYSRAQQIPTFFGQREAI